MLTNLVLNEQKLSTTVCVEIIFVLGWSSLMEGDKKKGKNGKRTKDREHGSTEKPSLEEMLACIYQL